MSPAPHPFDAHIGQQLRLRRKVLGMSQSDLAKCVGLTFQQIQKYERGSNSVSARRLYEFAAALHIPTAYFFEGYGQDALQCWPEDLFHASHTSRAGFYHDTVTENPQ